MVPSTPAPLPHRPPFALIAAIAWTLVLAGSLAWNLVQEKQQVMALAHSDARANLNKDMSFRRWATGHGGVYVPVTDTQKTVPWLAHVSGRDVTTKDGRELTLLNPASMLRQIMDAYAAEYGVRGRITGLKVLNPGNAPDAWEREQLERFTRGELNEVWEVADLDGRPHLRHLRAMYMDAGCEKCHAILGYQLGDLRGATGVNLPLDPYDRQFSEALTTHLATHFALWLAGLGGIGWAARTVRASDAERDRQQAERERAVQRYWTLFDQTREGILIIDPTTLNAIEFNEVAHQQLGYTREEFAKLRVSDYEANESPEEVARHAEHVRAQGWDSFETRHRRKDGSIRNVQVQVRTIVVDGHPVAHTTIRDITEEKRNLAELAAYRQHLEALVEQRTADLECKNVELTTALAQLRSAQEQLVNSEKLSSLGALVAGIAHELNTPIGNARTVASTIREQAKEFLHEVEHQHLTRTMLNDFVKHLGEGTEMLDRNLVRAADLIHSFKQVAVDRTSEQRRTFDLAQVIDEVVLTLRPSFRKAEFHLETDIAAGIEIDGYPGPLGQVVVNLVENALIHGLAGRKNGRVRIVGSRAGEGLVCIIIEDNGQGIPAEHLKRIFDPFFTTRLGEGGSGLGLNIVHNIVTGVMGGRVEVASDAGRGTRFEIRIPAKAPASNEQDP
jgi:PAS domain S-box-containing protein